MTRHSGEHGRSADPESAGALAGLPSPLDAVSDMRATAKWIIGAAAAVGWAIWHTTDALIPPATTLATPGDAAAS